MSSKSHRNLRGYPPDDTPQQIRPYKGTIRVVKALYAKGEGHSGVTLRFSWEIPCEYTSLDLTGAFQSFQAFALKK